MASSTISIMDAFKKSMQTTKNYVDRKVNNIDATINEDELNIFLNDLFEVQVHNVTTESEVVSVITNANIGDTVVLACDISEPLTITKGVNIVSDGSHTINNKIEINTDGIVNISGVKFNALASAEGTGAGSSTAKGEAITISQGEVILTNNTFEGYDNFYNCIAVKTEEKVIIENNVFEGGNSYHIVDFYGYKVANGTIIRNNKFGKCHTHNCINMYDFEEGAYVEISGNEFEYSGNAIRLSNMSNANATICIKNNTYYSTDLSEVTQPELMYPEGCNWSGLVILQDFTGTQDFSKLTLKFSENYYDKNHEGDKVLIDGTNIGGETQAWYVLKNKPEWAFTIPNVIFE